MAGNPLKRQRLLDAGIDPASLRTKASGGRKPWEPSDRDRIQAAVAYAMGATDETVASILAISKATVQKYLGDVKEVAEELLRMKLAGRLFSKAIVDGDTAALIFLAKNKLGMTDKVDQTSGGLALPGPGNQPVYVQVQYVVPPDPRANPGPPAHLLEAQAVERED